MQLVISLSAEIECFLKVISGCLDRTSHEINFPSLDPETKIRPSLDKFNVVTELLSWTVKKT